MKLTKNYFHLLNADLVRLGPRWNFNNVISPYYRIYYIAAGEGYINSQNGHTKLVEGQLYLIPSFTLCDLHCDGFLHQYFIQFFEESTNGISTFSHCREVLNLSAAEIDVVNFKRLIEINPGRGINRSDNPKVYEKDEFYKEYRKLNEQQHIGVQYETQGIIHQLLSRFMKSERFKMINNQPIPSAVLSAISYIQINIGNQLKVNELANHANLNVDYFSRIFHRCTGKSPVNFILETRIERAQYLIITSNIPYGEIAALTGFGNQQYFSRMFKKMIGSSPKEYRKQNQFMSQV
ncbi:AraC family transcriptional regulator [Pedobacter sp. BMA]|uniref:helix-turn-helix domain-containing protein n=1 Tax=Pedobacter sp. BMA TaxID=1663685 RepID=UPI000649D7AD|nr:AraC family transcriptional regulator [Pedobacter sp. BMA]KLT63593.1 regulator [Pedobacter sp. BMA]